MHQYYEKNKAVDSLDMLPNLPVTADEFTIQRDEIISLSHPSSQLYRRVVAHCLTDDGLQVW